MAINCADSHPSQFKNCVPQKIMMSAALVVDAWSGHLLLSHSPESVNVKLYRLYGHSVLQCVPYLTLFLHHFLVLVEKTSNNDIWITCLEIICLLVYTSRLTHLFLFTSSRVFWSDTKNIMVFVTIALTLLEISLDLLIDLSVRWTPVLRPLFLVNLAEVKQVSHLHSLLRHYIRPSHSQYILSHFSLDSKLAVDCIANDIWIYCLILYPRWTQPPGTSNSRLIIEGTPWLDLPYKIFWKFRILSGKLGDF